MHRFHQISPLGGSDDIRRAGKDGERALTNEVTVLSQNNSFGPTLDRVQPILDGRVVRLGVRIDF
jgi:hypothetical protein